MLAKVYNTNIEAGAYEGEINRIMGLPTGGTKRWCKPFLLTDGRWAVYSRDKEGEDISNLTIEDV